VADGYQHASIREADTRQAIAYFYTLCRVKCLIPDIVLACTNQEAQLNRIGTDCVAVRHDDQISEKQLPNVAEPLAGYDNHEFVSQDKRGAARW